MIWTARLTNNKVKDGEQAVQAHFCSGYKYSQVLNLAADDGGMVAKTKAIQVLWNGYRLNIYI